MERCYVSLHSKPIKNLRIKNATETVAIATTVGRPERSSELDGDKQEPCRFMDSNGH
jgi:hypothetical protein